MMEVMVEWWMEMGDEVGGAPPRRPGLGGGRRWRRMVRERERCQAPRRKKDAARDFVPLRADLPICTLALLLFFFLHKKVPLSFNLPLCLLRFFSPKSFLHLF